MWVYVKDRVITKQTVGQKAICHLRLDNPALYDYVNEDCIIHIEIDFLMLKSAFQQFEIDSITSVKDKPGAWLVHNFPKILLNQTMVYLIGKSKWWQSLSALLSDSEVPWKQFTLVHVIDIHLSLFIDMRNKQLWK